MNRRGFLQALPVLGSALTFHGCAKPPLAVAIHPWIGYETFYLAREFGWLPPEVSLLEGETASESLTALKLGRAEAACLTLDETLRARAEGIPLVVVAILDLSAGADALMVRPEIRSLPALAGRRIAVERSALGELLLYKMLALAGLSRDDVVVVDIPVNSHFAAWKAGVVDAAICYEPTVSLLGTAGAVRLFDSRRLPDSVFDVLTVRRDVLPQLADSVRGLVKAHFRSLEHLRINRQDAAHRIAARQKIDPDAVGRALAGVVFPDVVRNRRYLVPGDDILRASGELMALMVERRLLPAPVNLDGLFDGAYLPGEGRP
jgi:NitT/TauT family transport system substrate-binding protein